MTLHVTSGFWVGVFLGLASIGLLMFGVAIFSLVEALQ